MKTQEQFKRTIEAQIAFKLKTISQSKFTGPYKVKRKTVCKREKYSGGTPGLRLENSRLIDVRILVSIHFVMIRIRSDDSNIRYDLVCWSLYLVFPHAILVIFETLAKERHTMPIYHRKSQL